MTVEESKLHSQKMMQLVFDNTINKKIPDLKLESLNGEKIGLVDVVDNKTIIIASDPYCGFGADGLQVDFPEAILEVNKSFPNFDFKVVCLIKFKEKDDRFNFLLEDIDGIYENLYLIEESEAFKMNLFASPIRLYIKDQIVFGIGLGVSPIEGNLIREIENNVLPKTRKTE